MKWTRRKSRIPIYATVLFACALFPLTAEAHLNSTGMGPVYDGLMHFFMSPEDLVPVLALALLSGLRGAIIRTAHLVRATRSMAVWKLHWTRRVDIQRKRHRVRRVVSLTRRTARRGRKAVSAIDNRACRPAWPLSWISQRDRSRTEPCIDRRPSRLDLLHLRAHRHRRRICCSIRRCVGTNRGPSRRELDLCNWPIVDGLGTPHHARLESALTEAISQENIARRGSLSGSRSISYAATLLLIKR